MGDAGPQHAAPAGLSTRCWECGGSGVTIELRIALRGCWLDTGHDPRPCPNCGGSGWLPGFVAPA